jgi:uncharacterized membrane protein YozB (DUF420 family)
MGAIEGVEFGAELIIGAFILVIFLGSMFTPLSEQVTNSGIAFGSTIILFFQLIALIFILAGVMKLWKKITGEDDRPQFEG